MTDKTDETSTLAYTVTIETTNPDALSQLIARLESHPLDTDVRGNLHDLSVYVEDARGTVLWGSVWLTSATSV